MPVGATENELSTKRNKEQTNLTKLKLRDRPGGCDNLRNLFFQFVLTECRCVFVDGCEV